MKNDKIIWLFIAILIAAVAVLIIVSRSGNSSAPSAPAATTTAATTTSAAGVPSTKPVRTTSGAKKTATKPAPTIAAKVSGIGPLSYLISLKEPLVCSVKTTTLSMKRSGTVYVAGGKLRGDFLSSVNGVLVNASMIDDGTHLYAWASGATKGLELLAASSASGNAIANAGGIDLAAQVSYACNAWAEDSNVFIPPTSVTFSNSL